MSLEQALSENTAAMKELTAALKAGGSKSAGTPPPPAAGKYTKDAMLALVNKHKDKLGVPATRTLVKENTGKDKVSEVEDSAAIDKLAAAAEKALAAAEDDGGV